MSIKNIWDFKDEINSLKKENSNIKVLDLGCGNGNSFYHFHHEYDINNYLGIESNSIEKLTSEGSYHYDYGGKIKTADEIYLSDIENNPKLHLTLYELYEEIFDKIIKDKQLLNKKLNKDSFENIYTNNKLFKFDTNIEDYIKELKNEKFDIIIMSKILHYKSIEKPKKLIESSFNLLNKGGLLYIQHRKVISSDKKRYLNPNSIENLINNLECQHERFNTKKEGEEEKHLSSFLLKK